jgi:hypothetical protein
MSGFARHLCFVLTFATVGTEPAVRAADYFVRAAGDDVHDGTTPDRAWKSIDRAGQHAFVPGDRLLFRGGQVFSGNLVLKVSGFPTADKPVTVGSFGDGRATIQAGVGTGIHIANVGGVIVRDLVILGKDRRSNKGSGVEIINTLPGGRRLGFVRVENVDARSFGKDGIAVGGWPADKSLSGFRDVRITNCRASDNAYVGIHIFAVHDHEAKSYAHEDVAVTGCVANDNPGDPDYLDNHSGNGILLHNIDGGLIDGCTAFGNGGLCRALPGGPVGIWTYTARKVVIQHCVSIRNRTGALYDGGGFDLDGGVTESVLQYNYSAENDGAGYLVYEFAGAPFRVADNVVRFNISENDGRKNGYAGIYIGSQDRPIERLQVYHNTVFLGPARPGEQPKPLFLHKSRDCRIHNNLFIAAAGVPLADIGPDQPGLCIQGNHYWSVGGAFLICHTGAHYRSLADWRKTGMEQLDGKAVGSAGDPRLTAYGPAAIPAAAGERIGLNRYQLRPDSPLTGAGLDLKGLFRINAGDRDFWGKEVPKGQPASVGAHGGR